MFRYINMPKLVVHYLKEFSVQEDGNPSLLYKFIFCLCLPFLSKTFYRARLNALAIAECTNSQDQTLRVLTALTSASFCIVPLNNEYYAAYNGIGDVADFPYDNSAEADNPVVPYAAAVNAGLMYVTLNGASEEEVDAYLQLLIPFYIQLTVIYQ